MPAFLAVGFGVLYLQSKGVYPKALWGLLWLLFLPNTAYIFTDVMRLPLHWDSVSTTMDVALILQYICLEIVGLATFLLAFLPLESIIRVKHLSRRGRITATILLNFLIGFGMALGRVQYINSWVIFAQPVQVFYSAIHVATSFDLLSLAVLFGILCNGIYLLFRNMLVRHANKLL